jgi:DNA-binding transcriptional MerR regulator
MSDKWRIERLSELAARALAAGEYNGQTSGRVRDVPDVRTIRYYITLGLLDRPLEMQGRTAFYGRKHLLQLVAIKRLQAQGLTLVDVQQRMLGTSQKKLAELAALPDHMLNEPVALAKRAATSQVPADQVRQIDEVAARGRRQFWAQPPQLQRHHDDRAATAAPLPALILPLASGVSLLLEGIDPARLNQLAMASLAAAGANLREALRSAGLIHDANRRHAGETDAGQSEAGPHLEGESTHDEDDRESQ